MIPDPPVLVMATTLSNKDSVPLLKFSNPNTTAGPFQMHDSLALHNLIMTKELHRFSTTIHGALHVGGDALFIGNKDYLLLGHF
jgi:hypothetical protein